MRFILKGLVLSIAATGYSYAAEPMPLSQQQQIDHLRLEVQALKDLLQQEVAKKSLPTTDAVSAIKNETITAKSVSQNNGLQTKNGTEVNLYGYIRADAAYQFEGGSAIFNRINVVPLDGDPAKYLTEKRFDSTLTSSRIGLDFKTPILDKNITGKIEVDFRGGSNNDTIRIRHAYLGFDHWLVGQTTSSFLSTETMPELLDFNGSLGSGVFRTPMLRYSNQFDANNQYLIGLEKTNTDNQFPALTAKLTHKFKDNQGFINLRALTQEVRAVTENKDYTELGWGLGLSLQYKPISALTLNANYSHVLGDDKYFLYNSKNYIQNLDDIKLVEFDAVTLGATYRFNPKVRTTLGYGGIFYDENVKVGNDEIQQAWLNIMYNPLKPLTFGLEYIHGERKTLNHEVGHDRRIEIMAKYDF